MLIEGPLGRAHRRPSIHARERGAGERNERKHALQSRRLQDEDNILAGYPWASVCCFFQVKAAEHKDGDMYTTYQDLPYES